MKFINIRFFDGEVATSDGGAPEPVEPQNGTVEPPQDSVGDGGTTDGGGEDYSVFDKYKSYAAYARAHTVGCFKVDCYKVAYHDASNEVIVVNIEMASSTLSTWSMSSDRFPLMSRMWHRRGFCCR